MKTNLQKFAAKAARLAKAAASFSVELDEYTKTAAIEEQLPIAVASEYANQGRLELWNSYLMISNAMPNEHREPSLRTK